MELSDSQEDCIARQNFCGPKGSHCWCPPRIEHSVLSGLSGLCWESRLSIVVKDIIMIISGPLWVFYIAGASKIEQRALKEAFEKSSFVFRLQVSSGCVDRSSCYS